MAGDDREKKRGGERRGAAQQGGAQANAGETERVERALLDRQRDEKRQQGGSTPTEDVVERAMDLPERGVEWHAGEDGGAAPDRDDG